LQRSTQKCSRTPAPTTATRMQRQPTFEWQTASTLFPLGSIRKAA
jgi:hypothetical protein